MTEYVKKEDVLQIINDARSGDSTFALMQVLMLPPVEYKIKALPAEDVVERRRGKWIMIEPEWLMCSACSGEYTTGCETTQEAKNYLESGYAPNFCPSCGADMRSGDYEQAKEAES